MRGALSDSGSSALKNPSRKSFKNFQKSQKISKLFHGYPASKIRAERTLSTNAKHKVRNPDRKSPRTRNPHAQPARATSRRSALPPSRTPRDQNKSSSHPLASLFRNPVPPPTHSANPKNPGKYPH